MSLQAKIEAVIYAAEEPVTLAQLVSLFAGEALSVRAERLGQMADARESAPALFRLGAAQTAETAADEHAGHPASDAAIEQAVEHPEQVSESQADGFAEPESGPEPGGALGPGPGAVETVTAAESEAEGPEPVDPAAAGAPGVSSRADEEKRAARQREREAREEIRAAVEGLIAEYDRSDRGMEIREIAGGYRVATRPEYHDAVRGFVKSLKPVMKLSLQALETLAVIAYKQPVTAPEVSDIRGVDSGGVLGSLISRKLVTTAGRKQVIGRPILYKTTKEFLLRFGLKDLAELPSMEEFEKMAGELAEPEQAAQLDLVAAQAEERGVSVAPIDAEERPADAVFEASASAAPETAEEREQEELAANARANVQVDDETTPLHDLPGVTRDTAGRVGIDSRKHYPDVFGEDEH